LAEVGCIVRLKGQRAPVFFCTVASHVGCIFICNAFIEPSDKSVRPERPE